MTSTAIEPIPGTVPRVAIRVDDLQALVEAAHNWCPDSLTLSLMDAENFDPDGDHNWGECNCGLQSDASYHRGHVALEVAAALRGDLSSIPEHRRAR